MTIIKNKVRQESEQELSQMPNQCGQKDCNAICAYNRKRIKEIVKRCKKYGIKRLRIPIGYGL